MNQSPLQKAETVTNKKPPTTSIRIRTAAYSALQQQSANRGIKVIDLVDELVLGIKKTPEVKSDPPEFDIDGNRVNMEWLNR